MSVRENTRWKEWADGLRQSMMKDLTSEVIKTVDAITEETGSDRSRNVLHSRRFWDSYQVGKSPHDVFLKAGLELEFKPNEKSEIDVITIRLNKTWKSIMQRVLDRQVAP
ncbi:MAG: hypothetical protein O2931_10920 [Planctomycetota bacterium]|nr:hypothetical protein [Planctomycetota bacterium]MDA1179295.1 hypothetical protein [Planctomycetota bacterium]